MSTPDTDWSADVFREMQARNISTVCTVPDGGLTQLLKMIEAERRYGSLHSPPRRKASASPPAAGSAAAAP